MKYKSWSPEIWSKLESALDAELKAAQKAGKGHPVAAFDADGTLWDTDLGESFFKYQIKKHLLPDLAAQIPAKAGTTDAWRYYRDWKESGDPRPAYLWLAQINRGHKLSEVRSWAEDSVREFSPLPIFPDQQRWIEIMLSKGVQIFVVTASVAWAVEPGVQRLGIPVENVIGVRSKVVRGFITEEKDGPITYREGKAEALLKVTGGQKPFFACGNTMGDLALLECAKLGLAVGAAKPDQELFATEERLRQEARSRGWLIHQF